MSEHIVEYIVKETCYPCAIKQEVVGKLVRCKDCKHRDTNECPYDTVNYMLEGWDFCSSGERADNEDCD